MLFLMIYINLRSYLRRELFDYLLRFWNIITFFIWTHMIRCNIFFTYKVIDGIISIKLIVTYDSLVHRIIDTVFDC